MGKATGFIEFTRSQPILAKVENRLKNWDEFHSHLPAEDIKKQGARCMNCGVPFCHTGGIFDGATTGCPVNNLIPEWNDLVYRGQWFEAYQRLAFTNNFPEFTGRVCPAPCESSCVLGINEDPVMIKELEVSIIDKAFEEGWISANPPAVRNGKTVAIIGSGPAGLACADELNKLGFTVTVFERDDRIGGLLMYGIPNMKLEKRLVERRVQLLTDEGITFKVSTKVGEDITAEELKKDFDAIVLACGSTVPRDLPIEGRESEDVHFAMEFLSKNTKSLLDSNFADGDFIDVKDKNVIVIGGGDTGTDCVATSLRHGCKSLVQFEILSKPLERIHTHDNWLAKARTFQMDYGQEEAKEVFGNDPRTYSILTKHFITDKKGKLTGVKTIEVEWKDGKLNEIAGTEKVWKAEKAFLAMGFIGVEKSNLFTDLGVEITPRGTIAIKENKQTNVENIFAAGDCERGQSLVVWAIADGRKAAKGVADFLMR